MEKFSVLLIDDVNENIYSLKMLIEDSFDINIFTALSAQDAMAILIEKEIDLILTDVQMPDMDGFEFIEYIKNIEKTKNIPIIFITGIYGKDEYKSKGYNLGAIEYITKPIDNELLTSKLKIYIDLFSENKNQKNEIAQKNALLIYQSKFVATGELISMIAHQWRQPLTTLGLVLDRMNLLNKMGKLTSETFDENYEKSSKLIQHMSKTIDDFRNFYQDDENKENLKIKEVLDKSLELINPTFFEKLIDFEVFIEKDCEELILSINSSKISQVFLNLFKNSMDEFKTKNMEKGEIRINCSKKENYLLIQICDNAGGIPDEFINKIFEPYFSTKSKNGTGLGLYMSKTIIEQHMNGFLTVKNIENGACFELKLPINL